VDAQPAKTKQSKYEDTCPQCGAQVRVGVVRCWNCKSFMKEEIEIEYNRMISKPRPIIYSDPTYGEESDFELSEDSSFVASDDDFAPLGESAAPQAEAQSDTYRVAGEAPPSSPEAASPPVQEPASSEPPPAEADDVPHSVATGGEALWEIAKQESERKPSSGRRKPARKARPGFLFVFCPHGHRVEVQEKHRGRIGACPKCKAPFTVPPKPSDLPASSDGEQSEASRDPAKLDRHFPAMHVHLVEPTKLKIKQGSLAKTFEELDLCFGQDGLAMVSLAKKGMRGPKPEQIRKELIEHLENDLKLKNVPGDLRHLFDIEELRQLATVHPTAYAHESIFGGINVFGPGMIAVRLPGREAGKLEFVSMSLSVFRRFRQQLLEQCGHELKFEADLIPLEETTTPALCHYTDKPIRYLGNIELYENDPEFTLELVGWKCQACGLTVSEDGRKKENIGGKNGKAIAKAKCPKCSNPFGRNPLYALQQEAPAKSEAE
jgi:hypothetical protein